MIAAGDSETLRVGLRALATLGRAAPLDLAGFSGLTGLTPATGRSFLGVFESHGYARRVPGGSIFVLTKLGLDLLGGGNPAGRLVSEAIEPIAACSKQLARTMTLALPAGDELLVCMVAGEGTDLPRSGERQAMPPEIERLIAGETEDDLVIYADTGRGRAAIPVPLSDGHCAVLAIHMRNGESAADLHTQLPALRLLGRKLSQRRDNVFIADYSDYMPLSFQLN